MNVRVVLEMAHSPVPPTKYLTAYRSKVAENTKIPKGIALRPLHLSILTDDGPSPRFIEWADSTDSYVASASEIDRPAVENLLREMLEILETNLSEVFKRFDALEGLLKSSPARKELRKLQNHLDLFELDNVRIDLENISRGLNILL